MHHVDRLVICHPLLRRMVDLRYQVLSLKKRAPRGEAGQNFAGWPIFPVPFIFEAFLPTFLTLGGLARGLETQLQAHPKPHTPVDKVCLLKMLVALSLFPVHWFRDIWRYRFGSLRQRTKMLLSLLKWLVFYAHSSRWEAWIKGLWAVLVRILAGFM